MISDSAASTTSWLAARMSTSSSSTPRCIPTPADRVRMSRTSSGRSAPQVPSPSCLHKVGSHSIIDDIIDFTTIMSELNPSDITKKEYAYTQMIGEMATKGLFLFGSIIKEPYPKHLGDKKLYNVAILYIKNVNGQP